MRRAWPGRSCRGQTTTRDLRILEVASAPAGRRAGGARPVRASAGLARRSLVVWILGDLVNRSLCRDHVVQPVVGADRLRVRGRTSPDRLNLLDRPWSIWRAGRPLHLPCQSRNCTQTRDNAYARGDCKLRTHVLPLSLTLPHRRRSTTTPEGRPLEGASSTCASADAWGCVGTEPVILVRVWAVLVDDCGSAGASRHDGGGRRVVGATSRTIPAVSRRGRR